ncbi:MAG: hypothetical protein WCF12_01555 [Propionicimonas sp.]
MSWRRVIAGLLAAGLAVVSLVAGAGPAQARGWMGRTGYAHDGHTLGTLRPPGYSEQAVCIDTDRDLVTKRTSPSRKHEPELNYLMTGYSQTTSDVDAAALAYIVKEKMGDPGFSRAKAILASLGSATQGRVRARIEELRAEATRHAGPYRMGKPRVTTTSQVDGQVRGSVSNVGVSDGSGTLLAGIGITLTLSGAAVFDDTGTATVKLSSASDPLTVAYTATGSGTVSVAASTGKVLAGDDVFVHPSPKGTSGQRMVTTGPKVAVSADDVTTVTVLVQAKVSSRVSASVVSSGAVVSDTVGVTTAKSLAGKAIHVTTTAYGPLAARPAEADSVPEGVAEVETLKTELTLDANGEGKVTLELSSQLTAPGWYVFVEAVADDDELGLLGAAGTYGRQAETVLVSRPGTVETKASSLLAAAGSTLTDTAIIAGVLPDAPAVTVTLSGELRGPVSLVNGTCESVDWSNAPVATTIPAITITRDGEYPGLGEFPVTEAGCYSYGEMLVATLGDKLLWQTDHPAGKTPQTTAVISPAITTLAKANSSTVGAVLTDTIELDGTGGVAGVITGELLGPVEPIGGECIGLDWSDARVAQHLESIKTSADGTFMAGEFTVVEAGCYTYVETWTSSVEGAHPVTTSTRPGEVSETLLFKAVTPAATTAATTAATPAGLTVNSGLAAMAPRNPVLGGIGAIGALCLAGALGIRRRTPTCG